MVKSVVITNVKELKMTKEFKIVSITSVITSSMMVFLLIQGPIYCIGLIGLIIAAILGYLLYSSQNLSSFLIAIFLPVTSILSVSFAGVKLSLADTFVFLIGFIYFIKLIASKNYTINKEAGISLRYLLAIFCIGIISSCLSNEKFGFISGISNVIINALSQNIRTLVPLFVLLILSMTITNAKSYKKAISFFLYGTFFSVAYAFYELFVRLYGLGQNFLLPGHSASIIYFYGSYRLSGPFGEPGYFAGYLTISILFTIYAITLFRRKGPLMLLLLSEFIVLGFTYSTVGFLALLSSLAVYFILRGKIKYVLYTGVIGFFVGLILSLSPTIRSSFLKPFDRSDATSSSSDRFNSMVTGWRIFKDNVLTGIGNGNFHNFYEYYKPMGAMVKDYDAIANNVYIDIISSYGLIGSVLFFSFAIFILLKYRLTKMFDSTRIHYPFFGSMLFATAIIFMAYPSHNFAFLWFGIGIMFVFLSIKRQQHP